MMNLSLAMILCLAFCLLEHNKHCAPPCAIQISPLHASEVLEEKEEICICAHSVPRVTQSFPIQVVVNKEGLALEKGRN